MQEITKLKTILEGLKVLQPKPKEKTNNLLTMIGTH